MNRENKHEIPGLSDLRLLDIDVNAEWSRFRSDAGLSQGKTIRLGMLWKMAASVILIAGASIMAYKTFSAPRAEHFVADSQAIEATVETSTQISLNHDSQITCTDERADGKYNVRLSGEAYFDVEKNPERTFMITTDNAMVTVHGTSFNVCDADGATTVTVTSGNVEVTSSSTGESVKDLTKGKQIICHSDGKMEVRDVDNFNCIAWKLKKLVFNNNTMSEIMEQLKNAYNISYRFSNPKMAGATLTGTFDNQSLESVITVLEQTLDISITKQGDCYVIGQ